MKKVAIWRVSRALPEGAVLEANDDGTFDILVERLKAIIGPPDHIESDAPSPLTLGPATGHPREAAEA